MSLRFKFLLWVISLVMYLCLALGFLFVRLTERNVREDLGRRAAGMAQLLAHKSCPYILSGDAKTLDFLVRSVAQDEDVLYVIIRDADGTPIAATTSGGEIPVLRSPALPQEAGETSPAAEGADDIIEVATPVTQEMARAWSLAGSTLPFESLSSEVATVQLGLSTTREGRTAAMVSRQLAPLILVSCLLSIVGTLLAERKITKPVQDLVRATRAIASGDLSLRVKARSNDEFGQLAQSFNQMADALSATLDKLETYSHSLEDKVRLRTNELEAKTRALQKANQELQELDQMKSGFVSNVSHELRTPLTSIKAIAEILGQQGQSLPREQTLEFLRIIENQTDRLTRLIGDILDLSRLEDGEAADEFHSISLPAVISDTLGSVSGLAAERQVRLDSSVPEDLPHVLALSGKIEQVLVNLLGNALKFTSPGGHVSVSSHYLHEETVWRNSPRPVSGVVVSVTDTGTGIPKEQLDAVFDKFKQVENAAWGKPSGSGLGLSISKEIVERLGGAIWAESEVGVGSTFHFTLRPADAAEPAKPDPAQAPKAKAA
jgi:signal transduction histidine kinase